MAAADYRLCDVCGGKAFYDANLNYDHGADVEGSVRNSGVLLQHTRLDYLGDWCVICQECARTHECRVVQKDGHATAQAGLHGEAEARAALDREGAMTDRYESRASTHADDCWSWGPAHYECAVGKIERLQAEVERLRADLMESDEIREKLGHLLTRTAAALKGEPPAGVWHSWHDLPEKATQLAKALRKLEERVQRDEALLRQALDALEFVRSIESLGMVTDGTAQKAIAALRERLGEGEPR